MNPHARRSIVLFAHGSRDPLWRRPMEAVAARIGEKDSAVAVRCAYLELTPPDLPTTVAELCAAGIDSISVLPMFLGVGKHGREDLPALISALRAQYPQLALTLQAPISDDARLIELLAVMALE